MDVHGILFPGGLQKITQPIRKMWQLANQENEIGDKFPMWGTCIGMQQMAGLASKGNVSLSCSSLW